MLSERAFSCVGLLDVTSTQPGVRLTQLRQRALRSDGSHYEKRGKGEPVCIDDEIPFEIPESWVWCRFEAALVNRDAERIPVSVADREHRAKVYDYYGASGVIDAIDDYLFDKPLLLIGEDGANLLNRSTPIAFIARGKYWVNNHAHVLDGISETYLEYVAMYINSISLAPYVTGTAQPKMNQQKMGTILIPIPPHSEQLRILERFGLLSPLIDEYGALEDARERLDVELPDSLRKSILQMAVQGKLVPQEPSDEPASILLDRIRAERAALVKAKKVRAPKGGESIIYRASDGGYYEKRGKGEPQPIDVPFDIPNGWEWARVSSAFNLVRGTGIKRTEVIETGEPCVRYGELYTTYRNEITLVASHTSSTVYDKAQKLLNGEVVATLTGENDIDIGRAVVNNTGETVAFGGDLLALKGNYLDGNFAMLSLNAPYMGSQRTAAASGNIIVHLSADKIGNFLMAVPPLDEQRRIVGRCKELLATVG